MSTQLRPTVDFEETLRARAHQGKLPGDAVEDPFAEIRSLGLEQNVAELDELGFTVLRDVAPAKFVARLRDRILELAEAERGYPVDPDTGAENVYQIMPLMLRKGRVFEQALMHPRPLALITYLLGSSCLVSDFHTQIKGPGSPPTTLHCDSAFVPAPFPPYAQVANASWILTDYTDEAGPLCLVPGSHKLARHPRPGEAPDETVPIIAPAGSVVVFHGATWHSALPRTAPGLRVNLIAYFCRAYVKPHAEYHRLLSKRVIDRNPARFARLIGSHVPWGWRNHREFAEGMEKLARMGRAGLDKHS